MLDSVDRPTNSPATMTLAAGCGDEHDFLPMPHELAEMPTKMFMHGSVFCRHWIRPHGMRWTAGGDFFAWPAGYDKTTTGFSFPPSLSWTGRFS